MPGTIQSISDTRQRPQSSGMPNAARGVRFMDAMPESENQRMNFSTKAIHAGQDPDPATGAVTVPIYQTSTYAQEGLGKHKGFEYARTQNPTRLALEKNLAALESGKACFAFASGMAATNAVMTLLKSRDHVIVSDNTYGGT